MKNEAKRLILHLLANNDVMSLATVRPDGYPQATTVAYANDGLTLYFAVGPPISARAGSRGTGASSCCLLNAFCPACRVRSRRGGWKRKQCTHVQLAQSSCAARPRQAS